MSDVVFICGDSHASRLADFARSTGIPYLGGPIASGLQLEGAFFQLDTANRVSLSPDFASGRRALFAGLSDHDGPILSTVGFNSHRAAAQIVRFLAAIDTRLDELSAAVFAATVESMRRDAIAFHAALLKRGREVWFTCSPQLCESHSQLPALRRFEEVLIAELQANGARFVDVRDDITENGVTRDDFILKKSKLNVHGNERWARLIFERLAEFRGVTVAEGAAQAG